MIGGKRYHSPFHFILSNFFCSLCIVSEHLIIVSQVGMFFLNCELIVTNVKDSLAIGLDELVIPLLHIYLNVGSSHMRHYV